MPTNVRYHFDTREGKDWTRRVSNLADWDTILGLIEHWTPQCRQMRVIGSTADKTAVIRVIDGDQAVKNYG